jgi:Ras-related protein Rab-8A
MADEKRAVPYAKGKALADEYKIRFFETSAKDNINVEEVCTPQQQTRAVQLRMQYSPAAVHAISGEAAPAQLGLSHQLRAVADMLGVYVGVVAVLAT